MPVESSFEVDFDDCPECISEFDRFIGVLDLCYEDDLEIVLENFKYTLNKWVNYKIYLACGAMVILVWDSGLAKIVSVDCAGTHVLLT